MKKILNLLASINLITSGASTVVACGSSPTPPQKSEIQKLHDELNDKSFTIQNNNFWGNEASYHQDLLKDLEEVAKIPNKDDSLLSLDQQTDPFETPNTKYTVVVNIGKGSLEQTALVDIDWELTEDQSPDGTTSLFQFYTQTWPKEVSQCSENTITSLYFDVWNKQTQAWSQDLKQHITWSNYSKSLQNQIFDGSAPDFPSLIPDYLQSYFHIVKPKGLNKLTVGQIEKNINFSLQVNGFNFPLYYYSIYQPGSFVLPKGQNWNTVYQTNFNQLQKIKKLQIILPKNLFKKYQGHYYVDHDQFHHNEGQITRYLEEHGYGEIVPGLTLKGELILNKVVDINALYQGHYKCWVPVKIIS